MKNKFKTIYFPFEGYDFEIIVEYHVNVAGVFIVDTQLTNMVSQPVNKQAFYHILPILRYRLVKKEEDKKIKQILIRKLNLEKEYKPDNKPRNILIIASIIAIIILFTI